MRLTLTRSRTRDLTHGTGDKTRLMYWSINPHRKHETNGVAAVESVFERRSVSNRGTPQPIILAWLKPNCPAPFGRV